MENFSSHETFEETKIIPPVFLEIKENFQNGNPLELNSLVRKEILQWIYSFVVSEESVWHNKGPENVSLEKVMLNVNKLSQHAGVNKHDREHIETVIANSVYFSWIDFLEKNQESPLQNKEYNQEFLLTTIQHFTAALLHDIGYIGCLPKEQGEFRHFLKNSSKRTYDNHPYLSSVMASRIIDWIFEEKGHDRKRLFLHPNLLLYIEQENPQFLEKGEKFTTWKREILKAIKEHGTAQIINDKTSESNRSQLSTNLTFADKIHIENRFNIPQTVPQEESQKNIFPLPSQIKQEIDHTNACHTRVTLASEKINISLDAIKKSILLTIEPNYNNITTQVEERELVQPYTYDQKSFETDFETAYGAYKNKLKKILPQWDIEFSIKDERENPK